MSPDETGARTASPTAVSHPRGTGSGRPATTQVRRAAAPGSPTTTSSVRRGIVLLVILAVVAGGFAGRAWWNHRHDDIRSGTTLVDADGMAAHYGIHISLIAVTAAGGLVEFRYQVVDPDRASVLVHDPDLSPALVVEETGETLVMSAPGHHHGTDLKLGGTYFFLLANAHSALHPRSHVTVVIGKVRQEHIPAQG